MTFRKTFDSSLGTAYAQAISPLLAGARDYALVDFPRYNNIGDSAIYLGQLAFLDRLFGRPAAYVAASQDYRGDLDAHCPDGPVLICGGGNFGDLWPDHQHFRLRLLRELPHRRIVQLPQSIHFTDGGLLEDTRRAIAAHPDFTLCVRDLPSKAFAERAFDCPVVMAPDGAHCIPEVAVAAPDHRILSLVRTDKETAVGGLGRFLADYGPVRDWPLDDPEVYAGAETRLDRLYHRRLQWKFPRSALMMRYREAMYRRRARYMLDIGTRMLSGGEYVVSDRLHGHILCVLLGKPHISLDNISGKVGAYMDQWGSSGLAQRARTLDDLADRIGALVGRHGARGRKVPNLAAFKQVFPAA